jgi:hypothetical protein
MKASDIMTMGAASTKFERPLSEKNLVGARA